MLQGGAGFFPSTVDCKSTDWKNPLFLTKQAAMNILREIMQEPPTRLHLLPTADRYVERMFIVWLMERRLALQPDVAPISSFLEPLACVDRFIFVDLHFERHIHGI